MRKKMISMALACALAAGAYMMPAGEAKAEEPKDAKVIQLNQSIRSKCVEGEDYYYLFTPKKSGCYYVSLESTDGIELTNSDLNFCMRDYHTGDMIYDYWGVWRDENSPNFYINLKKNQKYYINLYSYYYDNIHVCIKIMEHAHKYRMVKDSLEKADYNTEYGSTEGSYINRCSICEYETDRITIPKVKSVKLSKTKYTYNKKKKTPGVTVIDKKGKKLKKGTDYTVSYSKGRKKPGKYKVKVKFKGKYSGTATRVFKIAKKKKR